MTKLCGKPSVKFTNENQSSRGLVHLRHLLLNIDKLNIHHLSPGHMEQIMEYYMADTMTSMMMLTSEYCSCVSNHICSLQREIQIQRNRFWPSERFHAIDVHVKLSTDHMFVYVRRRTICYGNIEQSNSDVLNANNHFVELDCCLSSFLLSRSLKRSQSNGNSVLYNTWNGIELEIEWDLVMNSKNKKKHLGYHTHCHCNNFTLEKMIIRVCIHFFSIRLENGLALRLMCHRNVSPGAIGQIHNLLGIAYSLTVWILSLPEE